MQTPFQITFHGLPHSPAVEGKVRAAVEKLGKHSVEIIGCRVVIEIPHRHHTAGNAFHVQVTLTVPGETLVADREPNQHTTHKDLYVAIRDAFDAIERQLEEHQQRRHGQVKSHAGASPPPSYF